MRKVIFFVGALLAITPAPSSAEPLVIQGSTTFNARLLAPYKSAIESMSGVALTVIPNKSANGLIALVEGRADLAMISAPLEKEIKSLGGNFPRETLARLEAHNVADTRIGLAIHPGNPVRATKLDTVRRILIGEIELWSELGGPPLPIRVVFVAQAGGVTQTVRQQLLDDRPITARHLVPLASADQVVRVVEQEPGALGLAQIRLVSQRRLPELTTEDVIEQKLILVTLGAPSPPIKAVIEASRKIAHSRLAAAKN